MSGTVLLGVFAKLYRNVASSNPWQSPTWQEVTNVRDVSARVRVSEIDFPIRGRGRFSTPHRGIFRGTVELSMLWDHDDADLVAFRDAAMSKGKIDMCAADGDITQSKTQGLRAEFGFLSMSQPQPLGGLVMVHFTVAPAGESIHTPEWFEVP